MKGIKIWDLRAHKLRLYTCLVPYRGLVCICTNYNLFAHSSSMYTSTAIHCFTGVHVSHVVCPSLPNCAPTLHRHLYVPDVGQTRSVQQHLVSPPQPHFPEHRVAPAQLGTHPSFTPPLRAQRRLVAAPFRTTSDPCHTKRCDVFQRRPFAQNIVFSRYYVQKNIEWSHRPFARHRVPPRHLIQKKVLSCGPATPCNTRSVPWSAVCYLYPPSLSTPTRSGPPLRAKTSWVVPPPSATAYFVTPQPHVPTILVTWPLFSTPHRVIPQPHTKNNCVNPSTACENTLQCQESPFTPFPCLTTSCVVMLHRPVP